MEALRNTLGEGWPTSWRNSLAGAYVNRGAAKHSAPAFGPGARDRRLRRGNSADGGATERVGRGWPTLWRNDLANAYTNRGNAKQSAPGFGRARRSPTTTRRPCCGTQLDNEIRARAGFGEPACTRKASNQLVKIGANRRWPARRSPSRLGRYGARAAQRFRFSVFCSNPIRLLSAAACWLSEKSLNSFTLALATATSPPALAAATQHSRAGCY